MGAPPSGAGCRRRHDTLLAGITRDSVLTLAADLGYTVTERPVSVADWRAAAKDGRLTEVFSTGTSSMITPVGRVRALILPALRDRTTLSAAGTGAVVTSGLTEGSVLAGVARPAGVLVGGVLAWRKAPFVVSILAAALLRLLGVP